MKMNSTGKNEKSKNLLKLLFLGIFATVLMFSVTACSKKVYFLNSPVVPAAEGKITVKSDKNSNYLIQMKITNLADVERLQPPKSTYVTWMETDQGLAKNIGRLSSSKGLNVSFKTVSSFRPTKIFITAEDEENVRYPGSMVVLTTDSF